MKGGWEIKKLGDVASYINGFAFKPEHWNDEGMPIIRIQNLNNPDALYNYCNIDIPSKYIVESGDILISWSASLGVYEWKGENAYLNQHIFKVVFDKIPINKLFLKYAVGAKINEMLKDAHGATMKHVVKKDFDNTKIIYPPLPEQERIVAELDCLSSVIEKQKELLKELDNLAQSTFYTMFGDPISNEKGWEVKKLGDCFYHIKNGANIKQERGAGGIPITRIETLSGGIFNRDRLGYANLQEVSKYQQYVLNTGDLLLSHINSKVYIGRTVAYHKEGNEVIIHGMNLLRLIPNADTILPIYMQYFSYTDMFKGQVANRRKDAVNQSSISVADLKTVSIPIPPISYQQEFASKIEMIEKQKELIKQSIAETETLFNSRMDYYFN
ncbi:MAG: restriction endonuclease subunit S [Bacteroidales bacterium]|nr:restriction endonuclease subunit S [Bacteroidales bacterium]